MNTNPAFEPIYEDWLRKDIWVLEDAVCLLLNVEPLKRNSLIRQSRNFKSIYIDTLDTAVKAINKTLPIVPDIYSAFEPAKVEVELDVFIKWAEMKGYKIPGSFQSLLVSANDLITSDSLATLRNATYWQSLETKAMRAIEEYPKWSKGRKVSLTNNLMEWLHSENRTDTTREAEILKNVLTEIFKIK